LNANLPDANLLAALPDNADATNADLAGATATAYANFDGADLQHANLSDMNLTGLKSGDVIGTRGQGSARVPADLAR
jgi:uncharacterized protein YjbI with pentapeptide repeats